MAERELPVYNLVTTWTGAEQAYKDHVRAIWPELADNLDRTVNWYSSLITSPAAVRVPPLAAPRARSGAGTAPVATRGNRTGEPTSDTGNGSQMALDLDFGDESDR